MGRINALAVLIRNDCAVLHRKGWRLGGGNARQDVCTPAWNALVKAGQVTNVEFMVTHNCPVFLSQRLGSIVELLEIALD